MLQISEDTLLKARRLWEDGRVQPVVVQSHRAIYAVAGEHGLYEVRLWDDGTASGYCTCPAQTKCSHLIAAWALWKGPDRLGEIAG